MLSDGRQEDRQTRARGGRTQRSLPRCHPRPARPHPRPPRVPGDRQDAGFSPVRGRGEAGRPGATGSRATPSRPGSSAGATTSMPRTIPSSASRRVACAGPWSATTWWRENATRSSSTSPRADTSRTSARRPPRPIAAVPAHRRARASGSVRRPDHPWPCCPWSTSPMTPSSTSSPSAWSRTWPPS